VTYVAPTVEEKTRTLKVRIEVDNPAGLLRPDMFADVQLKSDLGRGLIIPETSVIDTGERRIVFVERPDGNLEPREVTLGAKLVDAYQVLNGVAAGERVVVAANFLLDSESSLKAAIAAQGGVSTPPAK
jgi:multidrug efflux pump subunit AcrA (membrane-fusion protein)